MDTEIPEHSGGPAEDPSQSQWSFPEFNPWLLLALAGMAYYVYQNYLSNIQFSSRNDTGPRVVTPQDEERVRKMMEVRDKQQQSYNQAAQEMEEIKKSQPPKELGPISKQVAAKQKLRQGNFKITVSIEQIILEVCFRIQSTDG